MGVGGQHHALAALPPEIEQVPIVCRSLGGPQGRSGRVRKVSTPPEFDLQNLLNFVSRKSLSVSSSYLNLGLPLLLLPASLVSDIFSTTLP